MLAWLCLLACPGPGRPCCVCLSGVCLVLCFCVFCFWSAPFLVGAVPEDRPRLHMYPRSLTPPLRRLRKFSIVITVVRCGLRGLAVSPNTPGLREALRLFGLRSGRFDIHLMPGCRPLDATEERLVILLSRRVAASLRPAIAVAALRIIPDVEESISLSVAAAATRMPSVSGLWSFFSCLVQVDS